MIRKACPSNPQTHRTSKKLFHLTLEQETGEAGRLGSNANLKPTNQTMHSGEQERERAAKRGALWHACMGTYESSFERQAALMLALSPISPGACREEAYNHIHSIIRGSIKNQIILKLL